MNYKEERLNNALEKMKTHGISPDEYPSFSKNDPDEYASLLVLLKKHHLLIPELIIALENYTVLLYIHGMFELLASADAITKDNCLQVLEYEDSNALYEICLNLHEAGCFNEETLCIIINYKKIGNLKILATMQHLGMLNIESFHKTLGLNLDPIWEVIRKFPRDFVTTEIVTLIMDSSNPEMYEDISNIIQILGQAKLLTSNTMDWLQTLDSSYLNVLIESLMVLGNMDFSSDVLGRGHKLTQGNLDKIVHSETPIDLAKSIMGRKPVNNSRRGQPSSTLNSRAVVSSASSITFFPPSQSQNSLLKYATEKLSGIPGLITITEVPYVGYIQLIFNNKIDVDTTLSRLKSFPGMVKKTLYPEHCIEIDPKCSHEDIDKMTIEFSQKPQNQI